MNGRRRLLVASVISIQNSNFVYPSCQNCLSRLLLDSERYSCLRCGHSGEAKDTNYRYRLSLEVADVDAHDVLEVTVFGSCLDAYFGVTAKGLQRYIEGLNREAGEPSRVSSGAVAEAVETCFIGKKFVFGVKESVKHNDAGSLQHDCRAIGHPRALTACQMFVPNPWLVGCTVLQYLQQARLRPYPGGLGPPHGLFLALDQPAIELSSSQGSASLGSAPSGCIDGLSSLWPQSFGLTSSSTSGGTPEDPVAPSARQTAHEKQNREAGLSSSHGLLSQSLDLAGITPNAQQDKKSHPFSAWRENFPTRSGSCGATPCGSLSHSLRGSSHATQRRDGISLRRKGCSLLEFTGTGSPGKISSQHSRGPEKSWNTLPCPRQGGSLDPLIASPSHIGADGGFQPSPWFGDELPSSESLSVFIAELESNKAADSPPEVKAWERCPCKGPDDFQGSLNQSSPTSAVFHGSLLTGLPAEKLWKPAEKVEVWKEGCPPCWLDLSSLRGSDSQQEAFSSSLSLRSEDGWKCLSNERSVPFSCSSPTAVHPRPKECSRSSKEGVDQDGAGSKDLQAASSFKPISHGLESPCLQIKKTTPLNCERSSNRRHAGSPSRQPQQRTELADVQEEGFSSTSPSKSGDCHGSCREPLPEVQGNGDRGGSTSSSLQGCSVCLQCSYDASADLFDPHARAVGAATGRLDAVGAFSEQEGSPTEKHPTSELSPSELDASWTTSPCGLSLQAASGRKTSTPAAGSGAESEGSLAGTSDFVPCSQATPFAKPCRWIRLHRGSESILGELPLNQLSRINGRRARPRAASRHSLRRQCLSKFLPPGRGSDACRTAGDEEDPMPLSTDGSPAQKLFDNDSKEWIPPSERKGVQRLAPRYQKALGLRRRIPVGSVADNQIVAKSPLSENGLGCATEFTPTKMPPLEAAVRIRPIREGAASLRHQTVASPGFCALADGLSQASASHSVPDAASWSPELFADGPAQNLPYQTHPPECEFEV
ncbi:hypothetical protein lerEdw1_005839 [Lerista edwardsae]|nr:hypothetical protein lerEdw1_005839 [Lerista edwardsae]